MSVDVVECYHRCLLPRNSRAELRERLMFWLFKKLRDFISVTGLGKVVGRIPWIRTLDWLMYYKLKPEGIVLIQVQGSKMYVNAAEGGIVPMLLKDGVMEKYETELFKKMVKEGMVVVDIGANIGYYSLIGAKLVGKNGIVYAFEPEPSNYELLCKNAEVNGYANVVPVQKAVSNQRGVAKLWVNKACLVVSSFSENNVLAFSKGNVLEKDSFVEVETITLDGFFEDTVKNNRVDIIKIDTQGAEGLIVDGAEKILKSNNLKIVTEFWPDGLKNVGTDPLKLLYKLQEHEFKI